MIGGLDKNISIGPDCGESQPEYKKIQDYIYRFSDQIGMGNFSKVFKGINQVTNKQVAIKIIQLSSLSNSRLQQLLNTETKILKMLTHPNVIGCEEILSSVRNCYIITQLCDGGDLEKRLKKIGHFKQKQIYQVVLDIYEGLKYLFKKHIIHRDIKVSNIFIDKGVHKIADFGFAQVSEVDFRDISVGSPIYMSPEGYISNIYGPKTDVWAFGVLLYELIEGKTPCFDCRTEGELRQCLMKQIDYSSFSSNVSSELKNLIIQCLQINPNLRIRVPDIQNTAWMKKAVCAVQETKKLHQKQNFPFQKTNTNGPNYRKQLEQGSYKPNNPRPQTPKSNGQETITKNYISKFNNLLRSNQKEDFEHKRKHSTLDKTTARGSKDDSEEHRNKEEGKIFYSPKNTMMKIEKALGLASGNPTSRYESFTLNHKANQDQSNLKIQNTKNETVKVHSKRDEITIVKLKNTWLDKPKPKEDCDLNVKQKQKSTLMKEKEEKCQNSKLGTEQPKEVKDEKINKKSDKWALINEYKNYLNSAKHGKNSGNNQSYQRSTPKGLEQTSNSLKDKEKQPMEYFQINKSGDQLRLKDGKQDKGEKKGNKNQVGKVLSRKLRFGDCIGVIHYCRLCYKFACLLEEMEQGGDCQQNKIFLASWSIQLLEQINSKMEDADILFNNDSCMMNNPSASVGQMEKKKKLRDVTQEYLNKYQKTIKSSDRNCLSLKQASNYVYNLYLIKGHEFKQRTKEKKSHIYYALLAYISMLDRQTRNLMEFIYEIKNTMQGRQVEKLLNLKISQFNQKIVDDIINEGDFIPELSKK